MHLVFSCKSLSLALCRRAHLARRLFRGSTNGRAMAAGVDDDGDDGDDDGDDDDDDDDDDDSVGVLENEEFKDGGDDVFAPHVDTEAESGIVCEAMPPAWAGTLLANLAKIATASAVMGAGADAQVSADGPDARAATASSSSSTSRATSPTGTALAPTPAREAVAALAALTMAASAPRPPPLVL